MAATRKEVAPVTWENLPGYGGNQTGAERGQEYSIPFLKAVPSDIID